MIPVQLMPVPSIGDLITMGELEERGPVAAEGTREHSR